MNLIDLTRRLKDRGERAIVPFFTAGYPDEQSFLALVRQAAKAGCQMIEIGIPFSDPIADGPVIQESSARALRQGMTVRRCFDLVRALKADVDTPLLFMTYLNPILKMGTDRFAEQSASAGVSGVIVPDAPIEESGDIRAAFKKRGLVYIGLVAPTSSDDRIERIAADTEGFVYLVAVTGVSGARFPEGAKLADFVGRVRAKTNRPLYTGFGVSGPENARTAARYADGVIIGSALIRLIQSAGDNEPVCRVRGFLDEIRAAVNGDEPRRMSLGQGR